MFTKQKFTSTLCLKIKMYRQVMFTKENNTKQKSLQTRYVYKTKLKFTDKLYLQNKTFTNTLCLQNRKFLNTLFIK